MHIFKIRVILLLALIIGCTSAMAQNFNSRVVDKETQKSIGFASIYYKSRNLGIYSENDGSFNISIVPADTLVISAIGYQSIEIPSSDFMLHKVIELVSVTYELENVLIEESAISKIGNKKLVVGNLSTKKSALISGMKGRTVAVLITSKQISLGYISVLNFGISSVNDALIKVHIFDVDEDGKPGEPLLLGDNIVKVKRGQKKVKFPLKDRLVLMPANGVFAAIEWIGNLNQNESPITNPYYTSSPSKEYVPVFTRFMGKDWQEQFVSSGVMNTKEERKYGGTKYFLEPNFNLILRY